MGKIGSVKKEKWGDGSREVANFPAEVQVLLVIPWLCGVEIG